MSGTMAHSSIPGVPATGKRFSVRAASVMELRNGKIRRETDYYNPMTIMHQVGGMPSQPSHESTIGPGGLP
jgi:predicted ester cyclase